MSTNRSTISMPPRTPETSKPAKNHKLEFGIELCLEVAIALYQLGAEQMDLPHSFRFGLLLWIVATALATRMFWIFPGIERLKPQLKAAIATVAIAALIFILWAPITKAYRRSKDRDSLAQQGDSESPEAKTQGQTPARKTEDKKDVPNTPQKKIRKPKPAARVNQESRGDNSPNIYQHSEGSNSPNTVTINPPPNPNAPVVFYDFQGVKHTTIGNKFVAEVGEQNAKFQEMARLEKDHKWEQLRQAAESQMKDVPVWLTPYLFSAEAYANLGNKNKATELCEFVKQKSGGNKDFDTPADVLLTRLGKN